MQNKPQPSEDIQSSEYQLLKSCPLCQHEYDQHDVCVVDEDAGTQLVHVTCAKCHNSLIAYVVLSGVGASSIGMLTDLTATDVVRLQEKPEIDEDTVLSFHTTLSNKYHTFINHLIHK